MQVHQVLLDDLGNDIAALQHILSSRLTANYQMSKPPGDGPPKEPREALPLCANTSQAQDFSGCRRA